MGQQGKGTMTKFNGSTEGRFRFVVRIQLSQILPSGTSRTWRMFRR